MGVKSIKKISGELAQNIKITLLLIAVIWVLSYIGMFFGLNRFGIVPHTSRGLLGIFFAPFFHVDIFPHLITNTVPLAVFFFQILTFYKKYSVLICAFIIAVGGLLVWLFSFRGYTNHIGASGLIYGLFGFLLFGGFFRKNFMLIALSIAVGLLYGGILWGVLPTDPQISWESHLFGFISGVTYAYLIRKKSLKLR